MRAFIDRDGARWDVVLGRESWGTRVLLFVPAARAPIRQAFFPAASYDNPEAELDLLPEERLQQLLDESQLKTE